MYRHCISGGLLSSQLWKHSPHRSPQPTHLPLTQHSHNEKNELNESSFSNRCIQPGPWNEPSQLFLLSSPLWNSPQCSGLPASTFSRIWRGKRAEHHLGKDLVESCGNLVSCSSQAKASKLQNCDIWHLICTEHARSNVIFPVAVAACFPCYSHSLVLPAAELGSEAWCLPPPWGAMLSGAVPLWEASGCPQPSLIPVLEKKNTWKLRGIK